MPVPDPLRASARMPTADAAGPDANAGGNCDAVRAHAPDSPARAPRPPQPPAAASSLQLPEPTTPIAPPSAGSGSGGSPSASGEGGSACSPWPLQSPGGGAQSGVPRTPSECLKNMIEAVENAALDAQVSAQGGACGTPGEGAPVRACFQPPSPCVHFHYHALPALARTPTGSSLRIHKR